MKLTPRYEAVIYTQGRNEAGTHYYILTFNQLDERVKLELYELLECPGVFVVIHDSRDNKQINCIQAHIQSNPLYPTGILQELLDLLIHYYGEDKVYSSTYTI